MDLLVAVETFVFVFAVTVQRLVVDPVDLFFTLVHLHTCTRLTDNKANSRAGLGLV